MDYITLERVHKFLPTGKIQVKWRLTDNEQTSFSDFSIKGWANYLWQRDYSNLDYRIIEQFIRRAFNLDSSVEYMIFEIDGVNTTLDSHSTTIENTTGLLLVDLNQAKANADNFDSDEHRTYVTVNAPA